MKTTLALASLLLLLAAPTSTSADVHVHRKHHHKSVSVHAHHTSHQQQFKATPWDSEAAVKKEKCGDLCYLSGFWAHQVGRNCVSRPTDLCMQFKLASAGLDAVLIVAECECDSATDASAASNSTTAAPQH
ncbi:hypothetical protein Gpo141_00003879 [Globisporangium polare]